MSFRDRERREEVLDLFSEFDRHDWADQVLFERMLVRVERRREATRAWYYAMTLAERRAMHARQWQRRSPEERARRAARETARYRSLTAAERRARNSRHYASVRADPARMARRRERNTARMRERRREARSSEHNLNKDAVPAVSMRSTHGACTVAPGRVVTMLTRNEAVESWRR